MLSLALLGLRGRPGAFAGAFVALLVGAILTTACGVLMESALRADAPVERYRAAAAVVTGRQTIGEDNDIALTERARVEAALAHRLERVPGVERAIGDVSVAATVDGVRRNAHGWSSAALAPHTLRAGRAPADRDEIVVGSGRVGRRVRFAATGPARTLKVVGTATGGGVYVTDAEAARISGHPGRVDAIGVLAASGTDPDELKDRLNAVVRTTGIQGTGVVGKLDAGRSPYVVLTGDKRGRAEHLDVNEARATLIAVAGAFGGLALLIALFVVASTLGLAIQQREREIALLRAIAATPGQVRRLVGWEALLVALVASAAGLWPGAQLGRVLGDTLADHGVAPENMAIHAGFVPMLIAVGAGVLTALVSVVAAGRRAARVKPTAALESAAVEPRLLGRARGFLGLVAVGGAVALLAVSESVSDRDAAATTAAVTSFVLVLAAALLGPLVARAASWLPGALVARGFPVGGFLAVSNVRTAARRFSSASTPLVLTVAMACSLLFVTSTLDHATAEQSRAGLTASLSVESSGGGLPPGALAEVRRTPGVAAATGLTATTLGPSLGATADPMPAQVVAGASERTLDPGVTRGSLRALRGDAVALGEERAAAVHAHVGDRIRLMLGDGTWTRAGVVATYDRDLAFGDALLSPELAAGHRTDATLGTILVGAAHPDQVAPRLRRLAARYPGLRVSDRAQLTRATDDQRETQRWLNRLLVLVIFAFTSIAVVNTLVMIALQRGRELALLRLVGATSRQVVSMTRWEAGLIVLVGLGLGAAISLATLIPFSQAVTGSWRPSVPLDELAAILGVTGLLGLLASQVPTRLALRSRAVAAVDDG